MNNLIPATNPQAAAANPFQPGVAALAPAQAQPNPANTNFAINFTQIQPAHAAGLQPVPATAPQQAQIAVPQQVQQASGPAAQLAALHAAALAANAPAAILALINNPQLAQEQAGKSSKKRIPPNSGTTMTNPTAWGPSQATPTLRTANIPNGGFILGPAFVNGLQGLSPFELEGVDQMLPGTIPRQVLPSSVYPVDRFETYFGPSGWGTWGNLQPMPHYPQLHAGSTVQALPQVPPIAGPSRLRRKAKDANLEKKKKSVNAFMAYRSFHQFKFSGNHQSNISGTLKDLWAEESFENKKKWAKIGQVYSDKRNEVDEMREANPEYQFDLKAYLMEIVEKCQF